MISVCIHKKFLPYVDLTIFIAWSETEPAFGQYDFSVYLNDLAVLQSENIQPLFILDFGNNAVYPNSDPPVSAEGK